MMEKVHKNKYTYIQHCTGFGKGSLGILKKSCKNNIKMVFRKMGFAGGRWVELAHSYVHCWC
jgi:hypothetical protein